MADLFRLNLSNGFAPLALPRTPGPLGCRDAADPNCAGHLGLSPGALGINDAAAVRADPAFLAACRYLLRHRRTKDDLIEAVRLDGNVNNVPKLKATIWEVNGAVIYRLHDVKHDYDGAPDAYHPPTAAAWDGKGPGLARDSLVNAVGRPGWPRHGTAEERYAKWKLTSGCPFLIDYYKAKRLNALPNASPNDKAALDKILKKYQVKTFHPDFPDDSLISAWRLRLFLGNPSVSDDFLPK